jgi:hypothetical protein
VIGWNLFSVLFEKRWDRFHVRDRTGRIYVDLKEEWMRPLIDYMKYNKSANNSIKAVDVFLRRTMTLFDFGKKMMLSDLASAVPWVGFESSNLFKEIVISNDGYQTRRVSVNFFPSIPTCFKQIYSSSKSDSKLRSIETDIRFKPIFCLWKAVDGKPFVIFLQWTQRPSSVNYDCVFNGIETSSGEQFETTKPEKEINTVSDLFPIQFKLNEIDYCVNNPPQEKEVLEVYEVYSSMYSEAIPKSPFQITKSSVVPTASSNLSPFMEEVQVWYSRLKQVDQEIRTVDDSLNKTIERFQEERNAASEHFTFCWKVAAPDEKYSSTRLKEVISCRTALEERQTNIQEKKRKIGDVLQDNSFQNSLDPIVYFNVEGEIFTIRRSTILRVIPKSQLAVRVSGRWEEQPSKRDIDEDGNLIVNCHKESFKQILSALQICFFADNLLIIYVNPVCKDFIEETLDYLQIVPDLITTIEKPF